MRAGLRTFYTSLTIGTPRDELIQHLALAVDDEHGQTGVREVCDALVADDRDELGMWMPLSQSVKVLKCAIATRDTIACSDDRQNVILDKQF